MKLPDKKWLVSSHDTSVQLTKPKLHSCQHNAIVEGYSLVDPGHAPPWRVCGLAFAWRTCATEY